MKIGFLGNTNNYPFRLARALRALGHEVVVFVDRPRTEPRHRPEFHYADVPYPYPSWIVEIPPLLPIKMILPSQHRKRLLDVLRSCDGVVLNGAGLSLASRLTCPAIGLLTGADLDLYANRQRIDALARIAGPLRHVPGMRALKRALYARFVEHQRNGISACRLVEYAIPGLLPHADAILDDLGVRAPRRVCFMLTDIESLPKPEISSGQPLRVFSATRMQWRPPIAGLNLSPLDNKGTDTMLEGLRLFVSRNPSRSVRIDLISVGIDAAEAARQVDRLGLTNHVVWHAELSQSDFIAELAKADVVLENFNPHSGIGMAARDALAMGKPVIAWGNSEAFERVLGEPLPLFEALTADQICQQLSTISDDPETVARKSAAARSFAAKWFSVLRAAEICVAALTENA